MTIWSEEENPCWEPIDGIEPWEDDLEDPDDLHVPGMCDYCGAEPDLIHGEPRRDPFGGKICCRECWDQIVGGD